MRIKNSPMLINKDQILSSQELNNYLLILYWKDLLKTKDKSKKKKNLKETQPLIKENKNKILLLILIAPPHLNCAMSILHKTLGKIFAHGSHQVARPSSNLAWLCMPCSLCGTAKPDFGLAMPDSKNCRLWHIQVRLGQAKKWHGHAIMYPFAF